ncbi:LOW QUALITY PROTEIN: exosomal polycystin-1-interacting protein [Ammospiza maritima maritima]
MLRKPIAYPAFSICLALILAGFLGMHISFVRSENHTLIFTKENTIHNCSCSMPIRDCNYCLVCNCKTVLLSTMEKNTYNSHLTIWFTHLSVLEMILSFQAEVDLKLSFCSTTPLPVEYLDVWGLKLQVNKVKGQFPEQSVTISSSSINDKEDLLEVHNKDRQMLAHIIFLDISFFNGYSLLKSYSGENVSSIIKHFPRLLYSDVFSTSDNESCNIHLLSYLTQSVVRGIGGC